MNHRLELAGPFERVPPVPILIAGRYPTQEVLGYPQCRRPAMVGVYFKIRTPPSTGVKFSAIVVGVDGRIGRQSSQAVNHIFRARKKIFLY